MYEVVHVGEGGLAGEVVKLDDGPRHHPGLRGHHAAGSRRPGATDSGMPLSVLLGPGLIGNIYDGIQRPLPGIAAQSGAWIRRGEKVPALDMSRRWSFVPKLAAGARGDGRNHHRHRGRDAASSSTAS
jgi:V/A-type H+-transporting ATPase subunit A